MNFDLLVKPEQLQTWRPERFNDEWMFAGKQLEPVRKDWTNWR
jgi:hypothetical protein